MSDKKQRNLWIFSGICFSIASILRFTDEGFTFNTVLQGIVAILAFINVWVRCKVIKKAEGKQNNKEIESK